MRISGKKPQSLIARTVGLVAVFTLFYEVFGGGARYILADIGALYVNNLPSVMTALLFAAYGLHAFARQKIEPFMLGILIWTGVFLLYAAVNSISPMQSMFGFYIWAPFLLGTLICVYEQEEFLFRFLPLAWLCAVTGVFLNAFISFPWAGMNYEAHGLQMEVARQWSALGIDRLAGFSRASFSAATTILIALAYMLASRRFSLIIRAACYVLSGIALYLTTSKTQLFLFAALPPVLAVYEYLRLMIPRSRLAFNWARLNQTILAALVILMPLVLTADTLFDIPDFGFFSSGSVIDRVFNTWPDGFRLLSEHGNIVLGRGIGGIGTAQLFDEPGWFTFGDNLFVYAVVSGGIFLSLPLFYAFFRSQEVLFVTNRPCFEVIFLMSFCTLGIGLTAGVIEGTTLAMLLGFLVARSYIRPGFSHPAGAARPRP